MAWGQSPADVEGFAPVSVSSANYRATSHAELLRLARGRNVVNPAPRDVTPLAQPRRFVFVRGETFPADVDYEHICRLLAQELARKNYVNALDERGRIYDPKTVSLVLRVNYGVLPWRNPVVRTEQVAWDEGLIGKVRDARSLTHHGGDVLWDNRAGGNDDALALGERNEANSRSLWGSARGEASSSATPTGLSDFEGTRDFNILVIDAFDYAELLSKRKAANAVWTTFVAAPVTRGQKFSQALSAMLRTAAPYWGETTTGLQIFNDTRANVRIGEAVEVRDSGPKK